MTNDKIEAFTEDQKKEIVNLVKETAKAVPMTDDLNLSPEKQHLRKDAMRLQKLAKIWNNNGYVDGSDERVTIEDLLKKDVEVTKSMRDNFATDHPLLIPRVITNIAREAIEPNLVLTPMLNRIQYNVGTRIVFPAWGAITAADLAEGEEYPEQTMELAGQVEATIGKSGVAIKVTEETMRYSLYDVVNLHVRAAGRALARLKEQKVVNLITADYGNVIFNNSDSTAKATTGRNGLGAYNGTLSLDDLFYAYAAMVNRGFTPNCLIMHPFAWQIFAQDSIARAFGFSNGVNPLMWQAAQGKVGNAPQFNAGGLNQNTYVSAPQQLATTFTNVPSIFPTNFSIVISPYMPYTASTRLTDVILCDRSELGLLVVDEEVTSDDWTDPARDIRKIKFRERYGLAIQNDGKGIGVMKNLFIGRGYDFADKIVYNITGLSNPLTGELSNIGGTNNVTNT